MQKSLTCSGCYWFSEDRDMSATIPYCRLKDLYGTTAFENFFKSDDVECWDYIRKKDADKIVQEYNRENDWISCEDRLPEITENGVSDMVLLCWSDGQRTVGAYQGNRTFVGQAWPMAKDCRVTVVAWMPLPDAYEGSDTE